MDANVQLDKNLEQRGRSEAFISNDSSQKAREYVNQFTEDISKNLLYTSNNVLFGIGGVAAFIFFAVSTYKILSR